LKSRTFLKVRPHCACYQRTDREIGEMLEKRIRIQAGAFLEILQKGLKIDSIFILDG
jgi:hypothetical protein